MHARALTLIKDGPPCANRGSLNCTFLASYSAIAPTLADYGERPLRCIQLCQPLASVVLSQQPKEASSLHLPPLVSSSSTLASSLNPVWFTCTSPPCSPSSHLLSTLSTTRAPHQQSRRNCLQTHQATPLPVLQGRSDAAFCSHSPWAK